MLERNLGVRLFQRSTRKLTLTEAGEGLLQDIGGSLAALQAAISAAAQRDGEPAGVLKVSMSLNFGMDYILPLLPRFLALYPRISPDWRFESRPVDLIAEGVDAAIGGGFELAPGIISRAPAPAHIIAVASPAYLAGRALPADPGGLAELDGVVMRSAAIGRVRNWMMRNADGLEAPATLRETIIVNEPPLCAAPRCSASARP